MNWSPDRDSHYPDASTPDCVETLIIPRARDLGGFEVRRVLPASSRQMVGPFIFFDHMGPTAFQPGGGIDVRPHPHIGLATVTYLYDGEFQHRDSLGTNQMIYPGEVNWMIAGRGVTHSERTSNATRATNNRLHGIQTWVALPKNAEETEASFEHYGKGELPVLDGDGKSVRLILGAAWGVKAPTRTFSEMFYADAMLEPGASLPLPDHYEDRGLYITEGTIEVAGDSFDSGRMIVFRAGDPITVRASGHGARLMLLGGETFNEPRYLWWNFVASSQEKIEAAKQAWLEGDWANGRFQLPPGDDQEFIPLPKN